MDERYCEMCAIRSEHPKPERQLPSDARCMCEGLPKGVSEEQCYELQVASARFWRAKPWTKVRMAHILRVHVPFATDYKYVQVFGGTGQCTPFLWCSASIPNMQTESIWNEMMTTPSGKRTVTGLRLEMANPHDHDPFYRGHWTRILALKGDGGPAVADTFPEAADCRLMGHPTVMVIRCAMANKSQALIIGILSTLTFTFILTLALTLALTPLP